MRESLLKVVITSFFSVLVHFFSFGQNYVTHEGEEWIEIATAEDLNKIRRLAPADFPLNGKYLQTQDIDLADFFGNGGWRGIGNDNSPLFHFNGVFDGQGFTINNLTINRNEFDQGLFGYVGSQATLKNIRLTNVFIYTEDKGNFIGSLVGRNAGYIINCTVVNGEIEATSYSGGLVGRNMSKGRIEQSYSGIEVSGVGQMGGLVGINDRDGLIIDSYSQGMVTGEADIGGLVGRNTGSISNSYSSGLVEYEQSGGGLIGDNIGKVENSYWNIKTSNQLNSAGDEVGKSDVEMKLQSTFVDWDFENVWQIKEGESMPFLKFFSEIKVPKKIPDLIFTLNGRPINSEDDINCTYGDVLNLLVETTSEDLFLEIKLQISDSSIVGFSDLSEIRAIKTGTTTLKIIQPETEKYDSIEVVIKIHVGRKELLITPKAGQQKVYGDEDPQNLEFTFGNLVNDDDSSLFSGELKRVEGENVGDYAIQLNNLTAGDNYSVSLDTNIIYFKIIPREVHIRIDNKEKTYGKTDPEFTFQLLGEGLIEGDVFEGDLQRENGEDAGLYYISRGSLNAGSNYSLIFDEDGEFIIKRALSEITADTSQVYVYDGTPKTVTANLNHEETELSYFPDSSFVDAGEYQVRIYSPETVNYLEASKDVTFIIHKAVQEGIYFEDAEYVYNGEERYLSVLGLTPEIENDVQVTYDNNGQTNTGVYVVTAKINRPNYEELILKATLIIHKAQAEITAETNQVHVYDGNPKIVIASLNHEETELSYFSDSSFVDAGSYDIQIYSPETDNYLGVSKDVILTIHKAIQEGIYFEDAEYVYNGEERRLSVSGLTSEMDDAEIAYENNGHANAGVYVVMAKVNRPNYEDLTLQAVLTIHKAQAEITAETNQSYIYDGTPKSVKASLNHEETELSYSPFSSFIEAGSYDIQIHSPETTNYLEANKDISFTINKAVQEGISFEDAEYIYNGEERRLSVSGLTSEMESDVQVTYENNGHINAGAYEVTAKIERLNYEDLVLNATLTIHKAESKIIAETNQIHVYDGTPKSVIASLNHEEIELSYFPISFFVEAGFYTVQIYSPETVNYLEANKEINFVIHKASSEITAETNQVYFYDGTPKTVIASLNHDEAVLSYSPDSSFVEAGEYQIRIYSPETANYLEASMDVTFIIHKAVQEGIYLEDAEYVYNGEERYLSVLGLTSEMDDAEIAYENNGHANAGVYVVTAQVKRSNYEDLILKANLTIHKAQAEITAEAIQIHVYDGKPKSVIARLNHEESELVYEPMKSFINTGIYEVKVHSKESMNFLQGSRKITLTIEKAILTVIVNNITREFGENNPEFTVSYNGFKNNEDEKVLIRLPMINTIAESATHIGEYPLIPSDALAENYEFEYIEGVLTIIPVDYGNISLVDKTFIYNGQEHSLKASNLPKGVTVVYENNNHINAGIYEVKAIFSKHGYSGQVLEAILTVKKAPQTILLKEVGKVSRNEPYVELNAKSSVGLPVQLSADDNLVASLNGHTLLIHRLGTVRITASQGGDKNHESAKPITILVRVEDKEEGPIRVHQALSPNGDGINDFLILEGIKEFPENRILIINSLGIVVFDIEGYDNDINVFKGLSNKRASRSNLPDGTYFYVLRYKNDRRWESKKGWIYLKTK